MAEPGYLQIGLCLQVADQHRHRIAVVEDDCIGAEFLDVADDIQHHRCRSEETEDAGRTSGIADTDVDAVFLGDLHIVPPDIDAALQDRCQNAVRIFERFAAVGRRLDGRVMTAGFHDFLYAFLCVGEALFIDVHEHQLAVIERGEGHQVTHQIPRKVEGTGAYKSKLSHVLFVAVLSL